MAKDDISTALLAGIAPASLPPSEVAALYDRRAPFYDRWAELFEREAHRRALELAAVGDGDRVLLVAVGTGSQLLPLLEQNQRGWIEGVDISPRMLHLAQRRVAAAGHARFRLVRADARALPYRVGSFDRVICCYLLDLLPSADLLPVLGELRRVLHPMGRLVLANMTFGSGWAGWLWHAFYGTPFSPSGECRPINSAALAEATGFAVRTREIIVERTFTSEVVAVDWGKGARGGGRGQRGQE